MNDFCRCDNPNDHDGLCATCQMPLRTTPLDVLHRPPPAGPFAPPLVIEEKPPWRVCPDCSAHNNEHKPTCPRANWNIDKHVKAVSQR